MQVLEASTEHMIQLARGVIQIEADMVLNLINRIDERFVLACQLLHQAENKQGRIVVTGVGKSGHIAKKIAATLASTGNPAFFIHPSEAKHGDMGMLTQYDAIIALSYSGESEELIAILPFIKHLNIPLISLTGNGHSRLAKAATVNLDVSVIKEACPLGLAPTSSTTAALAMGDALAMVLLDLRGFTPEDFALTHPGGSLGKRLLLRVREIMHQGDAIPKVLLSATLEDALIEMTQKKLGMTTVTTETGELAGVFTDGDIRRSFKQLDRTKSHLNCISQFMSPHPKTISPELLAAEALQLMETHHITSLIVVDDQLKPIGVIHIHDIFRAGVV